MSTSSQGISFFTKSEIQKLFKQARRLIKQPGLDVLVHPKMKTFGRILVITPAKVGIAVQRNRIRRRFKSIFYTEGYTKKEFDWVIIVKKKGIQYSFEQLKDVMLQAFNLIPSILP